MCVPKVANRDTDMVLLYNVAFHKSNYPQPTFTSKVPRGYWRIVFTLTLKSKKVKKKMH